MVKGLIKTILFIKNTGSESSESEETLESKQENMILIRREGETEDCTYERVSLIEGENLVKKEVLNASLTYQEYISLIEKHFDVNDNESYFAPDPQQTNKSP